jgi:FkbM family methyltransferase
MNRANSGHPGLIGRVARLPLRLVPKGIPVPIMTGPLRGKQWISGSSTHSCWLGRYELDKQRAMAKRIRPNDVFYDIGANVGFYSMLASILMENQGEVHSFEPSKSNVRRIHQHLELNRIRNCHVHECAVSNFNGFAKFQFSEELNTMGHLSDSDGVQVAVTTLDQFVSSGKGKPPTVIKCDIEGAEFDMFRGAGEVLGKYRPTIFLATHSVELRDQCQSFLQARGYRLEAIDAMPVSQSDEIVAVP